MLALGVTVQGRKVPLGFMQTDTENARVLTEFLASLLERGLHISGGVLVIIDGSKGLRKAVKKAFGRRALVQRCQWHKRENIVAHLPKAEQQRWRRRLQRAYERPTYAEAKGTLLAIRRDLEPIAGGEDSGRGFLDVGPGCQVGSGNKGDQQGETEHRAIADQSGQAGPRHRGKNNQEKEQSLVFIAIHQVNHKRKE